MGLGWNKTLLGPVCFCPQLPLKGLTGPLAPGGEGWETGWQSPGPQELVVHRVGAYAYPTAPWRDPDTLGCGLTFPVCKMGCHPTGQSRCEDEMRSQMGRCPVWYLHSRNGEGCLSKKGNQRPWNQSRGLSGGGG